MINVYFPVYESVILYVVIMQYQEQKLLISFIPLSGSMKNKKVSLFILLFVLSRPVFSDAQVIDSTITLFNIDTVAKNLGFPWEITHGPDDSLWITEARGYRVVRMSAARTQSQKNIPPQQILKIPLGSSLVNFTRSIGTWPQGGMQGLVIHPQFYSGKPWVYLSYVYNGTCPSTPASPCYFRTKIVRCRFYFAGEGGSPNTAKDTLTIIDTVISNLPGSNDHNSGRLAISPQTETDGTYKLYYTIGDMGAGQFNNASRPNHAQNRDTCEGKTLRLNTEPDSDADYGITHDYNTWRQWIPNDNPFFHSASTFNTLKTPVYSYGHRNAQGIAWGNVNGNWRLYSSEHGDKSDDEVNIILPGANFGWPKAAGLCDDNYNTSDAFTNNDRLAGQLVADETTNFCNINTNQPSMFSFFNWTGAQIQSINNGNIFTWPTIAPSGIDFYNGNIPGWKNSLLVTSLKYGMYRLKLKSTGNFVDSLSSTNTADTFPLLHGWRVRDIAIDPIANSGKFWVVIDSTGSTSGPTGGFGGGSSPTRDGGKILLLTYKAPILLAMNENSPARPAIVKDMIRIYPNPVTETLYVQGKKQMRKPLLAQVFDIYGRMLKEVRSFRNEFAIDVSAFIPGAYLLKLFNGNEMEVQIEKFIKK